MNVKNILAATIPLLLCIQSSATSVPSTRLCQPAFEDTVKGKFVFLSAFQTKPKKASFFSKLKNKMLAVVRIQKGVNSKASTKSILGWVALGMIGLGILLLAATSAGGFSAVLFLGGLLTGVVALCLPKSEADKLEKKKSNKGAIIALSIGFGLVIALLLMVSSFK